MNWRDFIKAEMWKKSAILGWVGFLLVMGIWTLSAIVAVWRGCSPEGACAKPIEIGGNIVALVTLTLGIGTAGQGIKRATEWTPEELARADVIRENGNGDSESERRRAEDDYGAEYTP